MKGLLQKWLQFLRGAKPVPEDGGADAGSPAQALAIIEAIIELERERELANPWPDTDMALRELGVIRALARDVVADAGSGDEALRELERVLSVRLDNYCSQAEYGSDVGRLGSVLSALRERLPA
ncbi:MAG: hypothetical protein ACLGHJ_00765 [Gammaproteobacteria bacterium]